MVIKKDMSVLDVLLEHPETEQVFKTYEQRIGHCICCDSLFETIKSISVNYGLDIDILIEELREAVRSKNA